MDIKEIRQLVKLMIDGDLRELQIVDGEQEVHLKRGPEYVAAPALAAPAGPSVHIEPAGKPSAEAPAAAPEENYLEIKSPMVGTFYAAPSPDSDSYVAPGAAITPDSVVCIVEAMKVMNEIKAECAGTIARVCVQNAQPVEFGQVLFLVKPS